MNVPRSSTQGKFIEIPQLTMDPQSIERDTADSQLNRFRTKRRWRRIIHRTEPWSSDPLNIKSLRRH